MQTSLGGVGHVGQARCSRRSRPVQADQATSGPRWSRSGPPVASLGFNLQCCQRARPAFSLPGAWPEVRAGLKQSGPAPAGNHMD